MTTTAVIMMLIAMAVLWGGLTFAIINLARSSKSGKGTPDSMGEPRRDL
ncbi:MAG: methionine/alanine import family NSS transporter small subunit [Propioniciclava sp.]